MITGEKHNVSFEFHRREPSLPHRQVRSASVITAGYHAISAFSDGFSTSRMIFRQVSAGFAADCQPAREVLYHKYQPETASSK